MRYARLVVSLIFATLLASAADAATATSVVPSSAPRGARVVVAGTGLDASDVSVGFTDSAGNVVPSQIVSRSATVIEVAVPRTAATGSVRVTSGGATIATFPFTVTPDAAYVKVATLAASDSAHDVFQEPSAAAVVMLSGNILVADRLHHRIAIVQPNGVVSPLAGNGNPGLADGAGAAAQFKEPQGIAIDPSRALLYIADTGNNVIRRVTFDGIVTTLAGNGQGAFADGLATQASFKQPIGLAVDAIGNLYVADSGNSAIRLVTPAGAVTTIAGGLKDGYADGPLAQALFRQPQGVAVSPSGAIYVADSQNNVIRKIEAGIVSTIAGDGHSALVDGSGTTAEFKQPAIIALDDTGNILVADAANSAIRKLTLNATGVSVTTISGATGAGFIDGAPASAQYKQPAGLASFGPIYVADTMNNALRVIYQALTVSAVYPARGPLAGGNTIRVFGTGFVPGARQVTIGGVAATQVTFASSTELFVTVPSGPSGAVDVVVTTPAGTSTLAGAYTYLPPPTITSVTPIKGSTTGGQLVTVTGANFSADAVVTLGGAPVASLSVPNSTTLTFSTPANVAGPADLLVATLGGRTTKTAAFTYFAPPTITSFTPAQGSAGTIVTITGTNFDPDPTGDAVTFGTLPASITSASSTQLVVTVPAGATNGKISVTTAGGSVTSSSDFSTATIVGLSVTAPTKTLDAGSSLQLNAIGLLSGGGGVDVTRSAGWSSSGSGGVVSPSGVLSANTAGGVDVTATLGTMSAALHVTVNAVSLPPDPATVATKNAITVVQPLADQVRFLYAGPNAIQTAVAPGAIADNRVAVMRGVVRNATGAPLAGVHVTAVGHPQFGEALTRVDGGWDFALNGGGVVSLQFAKSGYLPAQRLIQSQWHDRKVLDDVFLVPYDSAVTAVSMNASTPQVVRGSLVSDNSGTRRATLIIPAAETASLVMPDGSLQSASTLTIRATEFTVGPNGPKSMPAPLPPSTAYTYCVDLSADEATGAGATSVRFSKPVVFYVDNFLSLPTGRVVPVGFYDQQRAAWLASDNGVVMKILSTANGTAAVDTNGDGIADDASTLATVGIDATELQQLATLYSAGQSVWRCALTHFSFYDLNMIYRLLSDANLPNQPAPTWIPAPETRSSCQLNTTENHYSIVDCSNQTLGEAIDIVGTPYQLEYVSSRAARTQYRTTIHVSGPNPPRMQQMTLSITIAGQSVQQSWLPQPNLDYTFVWDGKDAYGRPMQGAQTAYISIGYVYGVEILPSTGAPFAWGRPGGDTFSDDGAGRSTVTLTQNFQIQLGHYSTRNTGLGGWTISAQQLYDSQGKTVYDGGGTQRAGDPLQTGQTSLTTDSASFGYPHSVTPAPDGSYYVIDDDWVIWHVVNGTATQIGGRKGQRGYTPDGQPLLNAVFFDPWDTAVGPDGSLYINDFANAKIRKVVNGLLTTVAGNGLYSQTSNPDGKKATDIAIIAQGIAMAADGSLLIAERGGVLRVGADGIVNMIAGGGTAPFGTHPDGVAKAVPVSAVAVAAGQDGSVYVTDGITVRRITPDGMIRTIAGSYDYHLPPCQDGMVATQCFLGGIVYYATWGVSVAPDGTVIVVDQSGARVWAISTNGMITTLAGRGWTGTRVDTSKQPPNGLLSRSADVVYPYEAKIAPDGSILITDYGFNSIRRADNMFPAYRATGMVVPSQDGSEAYWFDGGLHTRTLDPLTGTVLRTLSYDANGLLTTITDADGNVTTIQRDAGGNPTAIVAPGGQTTVLTVSEGNLTAIADPSGASFKFQYDGNGLLTRTIDRRGGLHSFTYDDNGLLIKDAGPDGGSISLSRTGNGSAYTISKTTAEGRAEFFNVALPGVTSEQRNHVDTDGLTDTILYGGSTSTMTTRDGSVVTTTLAPDPRFGMLAPYASNSTLKNGSHTLTLTRSRSVALTDPVNPFSIASVTEAVTRNGSTWTSTYSASTRAAIETSPLGRTATSVVDAEGRPVSIARPGIAPVTVAYNSLGQIVTTQQGSRTNSFAYDAKMRLASVTDALQRTVQFAYDDADRVTSQTQSDGRVVGFTYDAAGNLTSVTPPSRPQHLFTFTPVDLESTYTPPTVPGSGSTQYAYNKDRQLTLITRPDTTAIAFGYDTAGRLSTVTSPLATASYSYDGATGLLTAAATADGNSSAFAYDGSLLSSVTYKGGVSGTISYAYDANLRLSSESVNGSPIAFIYDADDLLVAAGGMTVLHDAHNALLTGTTLGSVNDQFSYDAFGDPIGYSATFAGTPFFTESYLRDDAGRITQKTTNYGGVTTTDFYIYDPAGRLSQATTLSGTTRYSYDDNGNRVSRETDGGTESATYDAQDRLLTYAGTTYVYTANGELSSRTDASGTTTYTYDALGNLRHVGLADGRSIDYVIDAENRRVAKQVNGVTVKGWLYSGSRIVAETDGSGAVVSRFVYASRSNVPDYMVRNSSTYRIIRDHLGSPRVVVDTGSGAIVWNNAYDEYGRPVSEMSDLLPFGFAGGLSDTDTQLLRFGARDYEPQTGRWTNKDPILFGGHDSNVYRYGLSDPVNVFDPSGLADVNVRYFSGLIPHMDITATGTPSEGFFPATSRDARSIYSTVPSTVHGEDAAPTMIVTFPASAEEISRIDAYMRSHARSGYSLFGHSCAVYTQEALQAAGFPGNPNLVSPLLTTLWDLRHIPGAHITRDPIGFIDADNAARALLGGGFR